MDPNAEVCVGVDIAQDRDHTSVAAVCEQGDSIVVELVAYHPSADAADVVQDVARRLYVVGLAVDPMSPGSTLIRPLTDRKLEPTLTTFSDVTVAHGLFVDAYRGGRLKIVDHPALFAAIKAADQRARGDRQLLERRHPTVDMSPLSAAELALWSLRNLPEPFPPADIFF